MQPIHQAVSAVIFKPTSGSGDRLEAGAPPGNITEALVQRVTQLEEQGGDSALGTNANTQSRPSGSEPEVGGVDSAKSQKPITISGEPIG